MLSDQLGGGMNTIVPEFAQAVHSSVGKTVSVPCQSASTNPAKGGPGPRASLQDRCGRRRTSNSSSLGAADRLMIDALVFEFHPQAYALNDLISLLLSWGTHQVSFAEEKEYSCSGLRAVANEVLLGRTFS